MKPYYQDEWVTIYHGDCRGILPQLDVKVDLVLTDPPYGFGRFSTDGGEFMKIIGEAFGLIPLKVGSWAFVFTGTGQIKELLNSIPLLYQRMLWIYKPADCTFPYRGWLLTSEAIALFSNGEPSPLFERRPYMHDCYIHRKVGLEGVEGHPTVKPLWVIIDLVNRVEPSALILDPFFGSGTTGMACKLQGRKCVGVEIEEKYCEIAAKRCSQSVMDLTPEIKCDGAAEPMFYQYLLYGDSEKIG